MKNADISVAARILAQFPDRLSDAQKVPATLTGLGALAISPLHLRYISLISPV